MANRAYSNALTSITINELNNKTAGFRYEMLKEMGLKDDTVFEDGTHSSIDVAEINNKEVDIVAKRGTDIVALIEVKVGIGEDLQQSQAKKGEYEKVAKKYDFKLFYIIPEDYSHQSELPLCATVITWEEILGMDSVKGTPYSNDIRHFAEVTRYTSLDRLNNITIFTTLFTTFLNEEGLYHELDSRFNDRLEEFVNWYDLTDDEDLSIGVSSESGNVYLYVDKTLFDVIDSNRYANVIDANKESVYSVLFNLVEDVDSDDLDSESDFMEDFEKKIKKLVKLAEEK